MFFATQAFHTAVSLWSEGETVATVRQLPNIRQYDASSRGSSIATDSCQNKGHEGSKVLQTPWMIGIASKTEASTPDSTCTLRRQL